jgi:hypothetical protein
MTAAPWLRRITEHSIPLSLASPLTAALSQREREFFSTLLERNTCLHLESSGRYEVSAAER